MFEKVKASPIEILMSGHSVLRRGMMIYEEYMRRMEIGEEFNPELIRQTVDIIDAVIMNFHDPIEHTFIFPKFKEADFLSEMCDILKIQHGKSRELQEIILKHLDKINEEESKKIIINAMKKIISVLRAHIEREETEMFPYFKDVVTSHEFYELGEKLHKMAVEKWGERLYGSAVDTINNIEKALGINDLDSFTPKFLKCE